MSSLVFFFFFFSSSFKLWVSSGGGSHLGTSYFSVLSMEIARSPRLEVEETLDDPLTEVVFARDGDVMEFVVKRDEKHVYEAS